MIRDTRREVISLYRSSLRAARRFNFPSSPGEAPWSRVLAASARGDFDAHRYERDATTIMRLLINGRDALTQLEERARVAEARLTHAIDGALARGPTAADTSLASSSEGGGGSFRTVTVDASPYDLDERAPEGEWGVGGAQGIANAGAVAQAAEFGDSSSTLLRPVRSIGAQTALSVEAGRRAREGIPRAANNAAPADVRARAWTKLEPDTSSK